MPIAIDLRNLRKEFIVVTREPGLCNALISLFHRKVTTKVAVRSLSFKIEEGEIVGFIGPNGAGKSTTIKMMSGILHPTSGVVTALGKNPHGDRVEFVRQIGVIFGQRNQLWWDLPVLESLNLLKKIYRVPDMVFNGNLSAFVERFSLDELLLVPLKELSLGQRAIMNTVAAFMHNPRLVFLDEPSIGLDFWAKEQVLELIQYANKTLGTTVFLTTHNLSDIEAICKRVIVIDRGTIIFDGLIDTLWEEFSGYRNVKIILREIKEDGAIGHREAFPLGMDLLDSSTRKHIDLQFQRSKFSPADILKMLDEFFGDNISEIAIEDPSIESLVREIYHRNRDVR